MLPILPPAPSRTDPTNFSAKADAWVDALDDWTDAANALEQSLQLVATTGTSTSSLGIGTGSKGLTTQTGKAWGVGSWVYIASASSITNLMQGQVTAYNAGTGNLVVNITQSTGSGTYTDWVIALASPTTNSANLSGGAGGSIPWQSGVNTTSMLAPGTSGQILSSGGGGAPSWIQYFPMSIKSFQGSAQGLLGMGPFLNIGGTSSVLVNIGSAFTGGPQPQTLTVATSGVVKIAFMLIVGHDGGTNPSSILVRGLKNTTGQQPEYVFSLTSGTLDDRWVEFNMQVNAGDTVGVWVSFNGGDATSNSYVILQGLTYTHYRTV